MRTTKLMLSVNAKPEATKTNKIWPLNICLDPGPDNWQAKIFDYVYRRAQAKGKIITATLGKYTFEYALIFISDRYGQKRQNERFANRTTTFWLRNIIKIGTQGVSYNNQALVFGVNVPEPFRNLVGLHEHLEIQGKKHIEACFGDLTEARKNQTLFNQYTTWLHNLALTPKHPRSIDGYFDRAIPNWTSNYPAQNYTPSQYLDLFYEAIKAEVEKKR